MHKRFKVKKGQAIFHRPGGKSWDEYRSEDSISQKDHLVIISVDPGMTNCGLLVERRTVNPFDVGKAIGVETIVLIRKDFGKEDFFQQILNFLDGYREVFAGADIAIVERQVVYDMGRVQQHIMTYFQINFPHLYIVEQHTDLKTAALGGPKRSAGRDILKVWARDKAIGLLRTRGDSKGLTILCGYSGTLYDMCDTIVQAEAFCAIAGLPLTAG